MKKIAKLLLAALTLTLMLSVCSCANMEDISRDIPRVMELAEDISSITKISDPETAIAEAEKLLHPKSGLDAEAVLTLIKENEAVKSLDLTGVSMNDVKVGEFSTPEFKFDDEELGGNVYEVKVIVTVKGQPLNVTLDFLSDESMMGLYSFEIESVE